MLASDGALAASDVPPDHPSGQRRAGALVPLIDRVYAEPAVDFTLPAESFGDVDGDT